MKKFIRTTQLIDHQGNVLITYPEGAAVPCRLDREEKFPPHRLLNCVAEETDYVNLKEEEKEELRYYQNPAHPATIESYLKRIALEKHLKGDFKHQALLLADYVDRLQGATELQLFWASEYFIENDTDPFFPTFAVLKKRVFENQ